MAILYRCDDTQEALLPSNGVHWSLGELQTIVGGYIELARTHAGHWLVVDEDGKNKSKTPNRAATALYVYGEYDVIRGDALWIDSKLELDGPPDPKEE